VKTTLIASAALMIAAAPLAAQTANPQPSAVQFIERQKPAEVLATDFLGTPVLTKDDQKIGDIANLVFDENGHVELAVIGMGGFLGVGQKIVAVPFDSLKLETRNGKPAMIVDASQDQLKAAPTYETLDAKALAQHLANWKSEAIEGWNKAKQSAANAYNAAKNAVNEGGAEPAPQQH
jgi:hypothetical protein